MTAPLKAVDHSTDLPALMAGLAAQARRAAEVLSLASPEQKNRALEAIERAIRANAAAILKANATAGTDTVSYDDHSHGVTAGLGDMGTSTGGDATDDTPSLDAILIGRADQCRGCCVDGQGPSAAEGA